MNAYVGSIRDVAVSCEQLVQEVNAELTAVSWIRDEHGHLTGVQETTEALEEEVLSLREQVDAELELTQLGLAIDVINHEFHASVNSIRSNLDRLKAWAEANEKLNEIYHHLRLSFDHLENYLALFTPLRRRLYREPVPVRGSDIARFLEDVFSERLKRDDSKLVVSDAFKEMVLAGYPSSFYPVFVNLVDNSLFWIKDRRTQRIVSLDAQDGSLILTDNGPGIPARDRESVFELGFTRKPGGRGIGLYVSRDILKRCGYTLELEDTPTGTGTRFVIAPIRDASEDTFQ